MSGIPSKHIVFITGAFVSHVCWDNWKLYFETKGYRTVAPPWPHKEAAADVLRSRQPDAAVASVRLADLVDFYGEVVRKMPEPPVLIGHSLGGLVVQLLLQKGLGAAGIAIHPVPPQGVVPLQFSFYKATWKPLGFFTPVSKTHLMSLKEWQYAFTNGMSLDEQEKSYEQLAVPESKKALRDALSGVAKVDFTKAHAPLLFISGSKDNIVPAALNYTNYKRYRSAPSVTDYKSFEGRNHYVLGQATWREEAAYILDWLQQL